MKIPKLPIMPKNSVCLRINLPILSINEWSVFVRLRMQVASIIELRLSERVDCQRFK